MAISLTHPFVSAIADGADTTLVQPSDWNDQHTLTLAASRLLGRATGSAGAAEEISLGTGLSFSAGSLVLATAAIGTWIATPSSANLAAAVTDETGTGALVFANTPTLVTPILGTPTSGTLTNCTGLPVAGITASTSTALGVGSIELGHASDTTLARSAAGVVSVEGVDIATVNAARPANVAAQFYIVPRTGYMTNLALAANTVYYMPFWLPRAMTISDLGVRCTTGASQNLRIAIYDNNSSTNRPSGTPLAEIDSALVMATNTSHSGDIRGANVTLSGGLYWAAVWSDGTPTINAVTNDSYSDVGEYVGMTALTNWANARHGVQFTSAETFGTSFPNASSETITEAAPAGGRFVIAIKAA